MQRLLRFFHGGARNLDPRFGLAYMLRQYEGLQIRVIDLRFQSNWRDIEIGKGQHVGNTRLDDPTLVGVLVVTTQKQVGGFLGIQIEDASQSILVNVYFAGHGVQTRLIRLKKRPHPIIIDLPDRVVFVVVAAGALDSQSEERL